jgi:hypothetical protein
MIQFLGTYFRIALIHKQPFKANPSFSVKLSAFKIKAPSSDKYIQSCLKVS